jgi:ribosomal protein uS2
MKNCLQPIKESALGNIPTIAFCDTDSPMRYVDIGIPSNNKGRNSIGCLFWLLARMVLQMRGTILPGHKWEVMVWNLSDSSISFHKCFMCNCFCIFAFS